MPIKMMWLLLQSPTQTMQEPEVLGATNNVLLSIKQTEGMDLMQCMQPLTTSRWSSTLRFL
jgi:hypothetical protein